MTSDLKTGDRILAAASWLLVERGYQGMTTKAIAETAGVNEVTIFRHFGNKLGIVKELIAGISARRQARMKESMPNPEDTEATLRALAARELEGAVTGGGVAIRLVLEAQSSPEVAEVMSGGPFKNLSKLKEYFKARQAAGDLRQDVDAGLMAEVFFAITSSIALNRRLLGLGPSTEGLLEEETTNQLMEIFFNGVMRCGGN